jgi:hypothetical protein
VLFSDDSVARFLNANFESVWETVRPVPIVKVDFGDGHVVTRTLNGNIATHVCSSDGQVLDTIPGIYTPAAYLSNLKQLQLLANYVDQDGKDRRAARLALYHRGQVDALRKKKSPPMFVNVAPITKRAIEGGTKALLVPPSDALRSALDTESRVANARPKSEPKRDLLNWQELAEDTKVNETIRRLQIHEKLVQTGPIQPDRLTHWLYKEVLHADLDDPYLGLGHLLFAKYPFSDQVHQ